MRRQFKEATLAKITNPVRFSDYFGVEEQFMKDFGVLNPTLNVDTKLFMDPLLMESSAHEEISQMCIRDSHMIAQIGTLWEAESRTERRLLS